VRNIKKEKKKSRRRRGGLYPEEKRTRAEGKRPFPSSSHQNNDRVREGRNPLGESSLPYRKREKRGMKKSALGYAGKRKARLLTFRGGKGEEGGEGPSAFLQRRGGA